MKIVYILCALGLLLCFILKISDELFPRFRPFLLCGTGILFFIIFINYLSPILAFFQNLSSENGLSELFLLLFKALGIAFLISFSASCCRDLGEEKIADKIELGGKALILSFSLPILEYVLTWIGELTSQ